MKMKRENLAAHVAGAALCVALATFLLITAFVGDASSTGLPKQITIQPFQATGVVILEQAWPDWYAGPFRSLWIDNDHNGVAESIDTRIWGEKGISKTLIRVVADDAGKVAAVYVVDLEKYSIEGNAWDGEPWVLDSKDSNVLGMPIGDVDMQKFSHWDWEAVTPAGNRSCSPPEWSSACDLVAVVPLDTPDIIAVGKEDVKALHMITFEPEPLSEEGDEIGFWFSALFVDAIGNGIADTIIMRMDSFIPLGGGSEHDASGHYISKTILRIMDLNHDRRADVAYVIGSDTTVGEAFSDGIWTLRKCSRFSCEGDPINEIDPFTGVYVLPEDLGI